MPIITTRLEKGIYLNVWEGRISLADIEESERAGVALLQMDEDQVVLINDLSQATHFPMDPKALQHLAKRNKRIAALVMVNTPIIARTIGEIQAKRSGWPLYFVDTQEDALAQAHAILAGQGPNQAQP